MQFNLMVEGQVAAHDSDLVTQDKLAAAIKDRFSGTAIKITDVYLIEEPR